MISSRNRNIIVTSQFNINGSRGKDAGKFVRDYISRDSATDPSLAYRVMNNQPEVGDGVAFTLDSSGITRKELLRIADHVQDLHNTGKRAIQQMVISFDPDYLIKEQLVDPDIEIVKKGDYRYQYDDVRLRNAVRSGLQGLVDMDGYNDGRAVACIQWDTRHLHVHAVVYEDGKIKRWHYGEEKGVLRQSSLNQLTYDIDRKLTLTKTSGLVPSQQNLYPKDTLNESKKKTEAPQIKTSYLDEFAWTINLQKQQKERERLKMLHKKAKSIDFDSIINNDNQQL